MVGDNDAGAFATYGQAGQNYGATLLWTLTLLIPVLYVNQEMVLRLGAVTGVGHARLIFERFGRFWGAFSVIDLFLLNALTIVTEFIGISLALNYLGLDETTGHARHRPELTSRPDKRGGDPLAQAPVRLKQQVVTREQSPWRCLSSRLNPICWRRLAWGLRPASSGNGASVSPDCEPTRAVLSGRRRFSCSAASGSSRSKQSSAASARIAGCCGPAGGSTRNQGESHAG
jgi:hypothetical protein